MKHGLHILVGWLKILYQDSANTRCIISKVFYRSVLASYTSLTVPVYMKTKNFPNSCRALLTLPSSFPLSLLNKLLSWITRDIPLLFSPNPAVFSSPAFFSVLFFILSADSICLWRWGVQSHLRIRSAHIPAFKAECLHSFFSFQWKMVST